jgi:hypothetical protein
MGLRHNKRVALPFSGQEAPREAESERCLADPGRTSEKPGVMEAAGAEPLCQDRLGFGMSE